jgi:hypothetical protein
VAACAYHRYRELGRSDPLSLSPDPNLPLHGWS